MINVDRKMESLSRLKKIIDNTSGDIREMWTDKWYALVREIASDIVGDRDKEQASRNTEELKLTL